MAKPQNLFLFGGRGVAKTSEILADRTIAVAQDMPRAPFAFVADTYVNLLTNTIPALTTGWERKQFYEGYHYIMRKQPPSFWPRSVLIPKTWEYSIATSNGAVFFMKSLDRLSTNAGISVVHVFGDEAKYQKKEALDKLFPAIRGDRILFGNSPFFMGKTFCSDLPDPAVGEFDWMFDMEKLMDKDQIIKILQVAFIINDILIELLDKYPGEKEFKEAIAKSAILQKWMDRWRKIRFKSTLFYNVSSFANADILTIDYFINSLDSLGIEGFKTHILGIRKTLSKEERFYNRWNKEVHTYSDGYNYEYYDKFGFRDNIQQTSAGLKYIRSNQLLEAGFDCGNMTGLAIGQEQGPKYRILKFLYTIPPDFIPELAKKFVDFFNPHEYKFLQLYADRATNAYSKVNYDTASKLKECIEKQDGKATGWVVSIMTKGQRNIGHLEEFNLMSELMGRKNKALPILLIDRFECKELISSIELAPMGTDSKGAIKKVKTSERLPVHKLAMQSTNPSDAFKYLMCRKRFLNAVKGRIIVSGDPGIRGK